LRRVGVALAASIAVSTVASSGIQAASTQSASKKYGGTAKVAIFDTLAGWCFADNNANSSLMVSRTIYETLFEKTKGGDLIGLLAESAVSSPDLKEWKIKLRSGIKFHDGTDFNAEAVRQNLYYSSGQWSFDVAAVEAQKIAVTPWFKAVAANKTLMGALKLDATKPADQQTLAFFAAVGTFGKDGKLDRAVQKLTGSGLGAATLEAPDAWANTRFSLSTATAFTGNIKTITADNATNTVTITTDRPQNDVPGMLYASGRSFMRSPSQFTKGGDTCSTGRPIGTGPFMAPEGYKLVSTDSMKVVKNPNYWRKNPLNGDKLPYLDGINFTNVKEGSQRAAAVRKGTYDLGMFSAAGEATFIRDLRQRKSLVTEFKSASEYYPSLWLNQEKAGSPFKSKNARLAVLHCIDRANFNKVRTKGEGTVAKSLVGPASTMYSTKGFQKFSASKAKQYVAAYKAETGKDLSFSFPSDVSTVSQANAKFLKSTWAKCGITANIIVEESALIIKNAFNSSADSGPEQNAYDAISILLFEGTDVSFNLPFVLTNAFPATSTVKQKVFASTIGSVLSLNHHFDTKVDELFYAGQAATSKAAASAKFKEGTAYLQTEGFMGSISHFYYTMFVNKKNGITNIGKTPIVKGKTQRVMTNWGIDWAGVQKIK
jgi:ABC-type transport system substrate-binding protein